MEYFVLLPDDCIKIVQLYELQYIMTFKGHSESSHEVWWSAVQTCGPGGALTPGGPGRLSKSSWSSSWRSGVSWWLTETCCCRPTTRRLCSWFLSSWISAWRDNSVSDGATCCCGGTSVEHQHLTLHQHRLSHTLSHTLICPTTRSTLTA